MRARASCVVPLLCALGWLCVASAAVQGQSSPEQEELLAAYRKGETLKNEGKSAKAIEQYETALALAPRVFGRDDLNTAALLHNLANLYRNTGQFARAEPLYLRSLQITEAKLGKDHPDLATILDSLAELYRATRQYSRAEPLCQRSLAILEARLGKDHPDLATKLTSLAGLYVDMAQYTRAEPLCQRSLTILETRRGKDHPDLAHNLNNLALLYHKMEKYAKAEPLYQRSLQIKEAQLGKNHPDVATILDNLASLYQDTDQYARAEPLYQRCLQIREDKLGKDHPDVAITLLNLAKLYTALVQYARAEPFYQRSLAILEAKRGKDHPDVATALVSLATFYMYVGKYARAEPLLQRSLQIREDRLGKDHLDVAATLHTLAALNEHVGQYARAEALYQRSIKIREDQLGKDHPKLATTLGLLAVLYKDMGQYARAEPFYWRCLHIQEKSLGKDHPYVAITLGNLAGLYKVMRQYDLAESLYQRGLTINEAKLGKSHPSVAILLGGLADLYVARGQYAQAEPLYQRSLAIDEAKLGKDHPGVATTLNNLAALYQDMGQHSRAETLFLRSLQIKDEKLGKDHPDVAHTLDNLATVHAEREEWTTAADFLDRARRVERNHVARVLPGLAEPEQLAFLGSNEAVSLHMALSLGLLRRTDERIAMQSAAWLLNGKAVGQQALAGRTLLGRDSTDPKLAELVKELQLVRAQLAHLTLTAARPGEEEQLRRQRKDLGRREEELGKRLGQASGLSPAEPWVKLSQVRRALPADALLIDMARINVRTFQAKNSEHHWQPARFVAWIIPPEGKGQVAVVDLGEAAPIEAAVKAVRKALAQAPQQLHDRGEVESEKELLKPLHTLAKLVLEPMRLHLDKASHWLLSPDGALWLVPWSALPWNKDEYVVERHILSYLVSGRDLVTDRVRVSTGQSLILADPDYDLGRRAAASETRALLGKQDTLTLRGLEGSVSLPRVPRLPATAAEAAAIQTPLERYARSKPRVYLREQALEGVFKAARSPRVVVLSTHGFFLEDDRLDPNPEGRETAARPQNPLLRCGLLLAGANNYREAVDERTEDGVLTGLEIVGTDLRGTELVVLSACETGLGDVRNGEGVAGLRQAFQLAGAQSVLATLWHIPDRDTAIIMSRFFEKLAEGKLTRAEALQQAQVERLRDRRMRNAAAHPLFWAAFTLTGP